MFKFVSRIETKVLAAAAGSGAGATVATALLWAGGVFIWHAPNTAAAADNAVAAVPTPISALVLLGVTSVGSLLAGYKAPASNHAGNNATGAVMDDSTAGHDEADLPADDTGVDAPVPDTIA